MKPRDREALAQLDRMEKHLRKLQIKGEDVDLDLARVNGARRTILLLADARKESK